MNRRSFIQSMAAAFGAIATGSRLSMQDQPPVIDYSLFTKKQDDCCRWPSLVHPFSVDGAVYATDSRVLIRHPGEWSGAEAGRVPDVSKLWWDEFAQSGWSRIGTPIFERHKLGANCPECRGEGFVGPLVPCLFMEDDEYDHDCKHCNEGMTGKRCLAGCNKGCVNYRERINGGLFCPDYMARLRTLGDIDVRTIEVPSRSIVYGGGHVLLVRGPHDVRGMLCGMTD